MLSAHDKYSLLNIDNLTQPIQMQSSEKQNFFSDCFSQLLKSSSNFIHFQKKMTVIADVFPKLQTPKNVVRSMSKKCRFRGTFEKQHGKRAQTLLKSQRQHFYHIYWTMWRQLTHKKSLVAIYKILSLFVNTLIANHNYSVLNRDNSTQQIQMQLSQKQKSFSELFSWVWKSSLNCEHFQAKYDPHSWCISEITNSKKRG